MLIAKNRAEPAVFVLFFYNFSTIRGFCGRGFHGFSSATATTRAMRRRAWTKARVAAIKSSRPMVSPDALPGLSPTRPAVADLTLSEAQALHAKPGSAPAAGPEEALASAGAFGARMNRWLLTPEGGHMRRDADSILLRARPSTCGPRRIRGRQDRVGVAT